MSTIPDELSDFVKAALARAVPRAEIDGVLRVSWLLARDLAAEEAGTNIYSRDPETGESYRYTVKASDAYEMCAEFARDWDSRTDFWSHAAGPRCFQVTAKRIVP